MGPHLDFNERPFIVIWETTQACDLACVHCRACAQPLRSALELNTQEAKRLIDEVKALGAPVFVLTGGDPLKRPDIFQLVKYASTHGVRISLTPSATPLLTQQAIGQLKQCGLARLAISLDGPTAEVHDAFRRVAGSYDWTLSAVRWAREIGLPVQINTTITRHNLKYLDSMIARLEKLDIVLWSVFFLVPTGRGSAIDLISADEFEQVFEKLYETFPPGIVRYQEHRSAALPPVPAAAPNGRKAQGEWTVSASSNRNEHRGWDWSSSPRHQ